jgi:hypothetical protein
MDQNVTQHKVRAVEDLSLEQTQLIYGGATTIGSTSTGTGSVYSCGSNCSTIVGVDDETTQTCHYYP